MISVDNAELLARRVLFPELPQRWQHVCAVADRASVFRFVYNDEQANLLKAAAFLHDVGYASSIRKTGFHPYDGAVFLRQLGLDERIVGLVAHHSCACLEAPLHDLDHKLARDFPRDDALPHDALLFCDLTTGPIGQPMTIDERLVDIRRRYQPGTVVARFIDRAEPEMRAAIGRVEAVLASTLHLV